MNHNGVNNIFFFQAGTRVLATTIQGSTQLPGRKFEPKVTLMTVSE